MRLLGAASGVALAVAFCGSALAGQEPYIAVVGDDYYANGFYLSYKEQQFLHANPEWVYTYTTAHTFWEQFRTQNQRIFPNPTSPAPQVQPEVCDTEGEWRSAQEWYDRGNPNYLIAHGNAGFYEWDVVLPKKPRGNINLALQLGVLKDNAWASNIAEGGHYHTIEVCAGETGERLGVGICNRAEDNPRIPPVIPNWLPVVTATAIAGPFANFSTPFSLTAYKQPSNFVLAIPQPAPAPAAPNPTAATLLVGSPDNRVVLKGCLTENILVKIPVTGYSNILEQTETDLEAGDKIRVRLDFPNGHSMDIYGHRESLRVMGLGDPNTLIGPGPL
jgi:hypothetical protein